MRSMQVIGSIALSCWFAAIASEPPAGDQDRDGLPDELEQALLVRFAPTFMLNAADCDERPAEFRPGSVSPRAIAKNGAIYGQAFPVRSLSHGAGIELHYYHLWERDCGRRGHALDVEHVAALIAPTDSGTSSESAALYWYASAHQNTVCDASHAARASAIGAQEHGPLVWISEGKHASFLSRELCGRGCGGDRCEQTTQLTVRKIVNIGELGAPMNGAVWAASNLWPLAPKMGTDFNPMVMARLDAPGADAVVPVHASPHGVQPVLRAGGSTAGALDMSNRRTDEALDTASGKVDRSLRRARHSVGAWLRRMAN